MKKKILSFLLALLMVVSIFPAPAFATDSTDVTVTETPTEPGCNCSAEEGMPHAATCPCYTCPNCGAAEWHETCPGADETEEPEVTVCEICNNDPCTCGETTACEICGNDPCTCETAGEEEEPTLSPYRVNIGKKATINSIYTGSLYISADASLENGWSTVQPTSDSLFTAELTLVIQDVYDNGVELWYKVCAVEGETLPNSLAAKPWVFQNLIGDSADYDTLIIVEEENTCGCCDSCTGAEGCACECGECDFCEKEPENTCGCCDECTGAEGCTCECGECDFCEKEEEPEVPSISASVNGQTVTVTGEALPEGATLQVMPFYEYENLFEGDNAFAWDIKIVNKDGSCWEPADNEKVEVKIANPIASVGENVTIIHLLEEETAILKAVANGNILDFNVVNEVMYSCYDGALEAYERVTGKTNCLAYEYITVPIVEDGMILFYADSFSVYIWDGSFYSAGAGTTQGSAILVHTSGDIIGSPAFAYDTIYVTKDQTVYLDIGGTWVTNRTWEVSSGAPIDFQNYNGNNWDRRFTINSGTAIGTQFSIWAKVNRVGGAWSRTLYFVVVEERSLSYNANGKTCTLPDDVVWVTTGPNAGSNSHVSPSSITIGAPTNVQTGYKFSYWTTNADGSGTKYYSGDKFNVTTSTASTPLYAKWDPITYTIKFNANGGTGSMDAQTMTYDQAATLNENQFKPQPGYVFAGWSTSATGSVVYSDKATISDNLASTQDAVVTLYAVWTNTMEFTDVRIGLNESYWFTDYKYTVTADGVASSSYHAFPAEPAVQSILYTRETKDDSGNWVISDNAELPGTASLYIDPSIVYSNLFRSSVIATDSTWGVADPTGADTKAFLKFTEADYTAMIKVWLQSMADRTDDTPNADGTYNINYKGTTHITDVNWNEEVNNWEEYEVIPYVIKMEKSGGSSTYNCWRIDMIIAPMRYLTLSYDLNINTAIGYSLTGGSSIPNTQYERDTTQNALASPFAYNSKIEVSKTVNGVKYTAEFLYWEDEQGNKYGTGYNSTVLMDGHKNLKAIWRYPDQTMGSLRVEKDVTVPVNTGLTPDTSKAFTITVKLGTSGSYPYTKYSSTGIVTETSSFTGTTKSFSLKADEYVIITGINQGTTYTVSETAPTGYTNKSGTITGTIQAGNTMPATIVNENSSYTESFNFNGGSNTNTSVTVVYGSTNYYDVSWLNPTRTGHKFLGWFTAEEDGTQVYTDEGICIDGAYWSSKKWIGTADLPLYAQWEEEKYTVTFVDDDGTTILSEAEYEYGTPAANIVKPTGPSKAATAEYTYEFTGWTPALSAVTADVTYKATYKATKRSYTITWLNDDNSVIDTTTVEYGTVPTHANPSKAATAEYTYTFSGWTPEVVAVTGEATYKATYTAAKNKYTIIWKNEDGTVLETDTGVEYGTIPSYDGETPTKERHNQYSYTFRDWGVELKPVTGDVIYTATFDPHENFYTVTWVNYNGTELEKDENVAWDTMPEYNGATPIKAGNAQFSYTFSGWNPTVSVVRGNVTYTAQFTVSINDYTVTWKNEDGTVLETDENVVYGAMPSYDGETPEKAATAQYTYTFDGWDKEIVAVTGDVTYTAKFSAMVNKYTVTFVDEDGTTILMAAAEYEYGTAAEDIVKPTDPTKEATNQYTYAFDKWTPEIADVTGDATYTATYTEADRMYTLTAEIDRGTVTASVSVKYEQDAVIYVEPPLGYEVIKYQMNGKTEQTLAGMVNPFNFRVPQMRSDAHVKFTTAAIEYTITYELDSGSLHEGVTNPGTYTVETETFTLNNPTKAGYKFLGWAESANATAGSETVTIEKGTTGDKTFYAVWERSLVDLTITATTADSEQSFIFTVSGTRSDGVAFAPIDVVLCSENNFQVTIKDMPVGEYTVTEKDGWSWREDSVDSKTADLRTTSQTVSFDFGVVNDLHWLSGYSYKRKKGGS